MNLNKRKEDLKKNGICIDGKDYSVHVKGSISGNCEEQLTSTDCRPTLGRLSANSINKRTSCLTLVTRLNNNMCSKKSARLPSLLWPEPM